MGTESPSICKQIMRKTKDQVGGNNIFFGADREFGSKPLNLKFKNDIFKEIIP